MAANIRTAMNDAHPFDSFGSPDWTLLEEGRLPPPPLPREMFGPTWSELERLATDKGCPVDYVALAWLVSCASLIGAKRRACPYDVGAWEEPSILWLGLVGEPSSNKSPALDPFLSILRKLEEEAADDYEEDLKAHRADCERAKVEFQVFQENVKAAVKEGLPTPAMPDGAHEPAAPKRKRFIVQDATPESVGTILSGNPQGVVMVRDELAGWLESFDRYTNGGRPFWLEAFGGRAFTIDRKGTDAPVRVPYNGVSVVGGIQPGKLSDAMLKSTDDGLTARLLFTWPTKRPLSRPTATANLKAFENAARRLADLEWGYDDDGKRTHRAVRLTDAAGDVFHKCRQFYADREEEVGGKLRSFVGKLPGLTLRLALASELGRWAYIGGREPDTISADTIESVADFVAGYAIPMAQRVYGSAALPEAERNAATLARWVRSEGLRSINAREVRRRKLPGLDEGAAVHSAIDLLVEGNWLRPAPSRKGGSIGRQSEDYTVNPTVLMKEAA